MAGDVEGASGHRGTPSDPQTTRDHGLSAGQSGGNECYSLQWILSLP